MMRTECYFLTGYQLSSYKIIDISLSLLSVNLTASAVAFISATMVLEAIAVCNISNSRIVSYLPFTY